MINITEKELGLTRVEVLRDDQSNRLKRGEYYWAIQCAIISLSIEYIICKEFSDDISKWRKISFHGSTLLSGQSIPLRQIECDDFWLILGKLSLA